MAKYNIEHLTQSSILQKYAKEPVRNLPKTIDNTLANNNMKQRAYGGRIRHAYGTPIKNTWGGGEFLSVGASAASGALAGMGAGAAMGLATGNPLGMIIGAGLGLATGILGSAGKAKARAQALEQNRQVTMGNMASRTETDTIEAGYDKNANVTSFYLKGGRLHAAGGMIPGINPLAHDSEVAIGPSHEEGGIPVGPDDEVEGGETLQQDPNSGDTLVFSDKLSPDGQNTYADISMPLMQRKGELEKAFAISEKSITKERSTLENGKSSVLQTGSAMRRAQIGNNKSSRALAEIEQINMQLQQLFEAQEKQNGNAEDPAQTEANANDGLSLEQPTEEQQMRYGGRIQHGKGGVASDWNPYKPWIDGSIEDMRANFRMQGVNPAFINNLATSPVAPKPAFTGKASSSVNNNSTVSKSLPIPQQVAANTVMARWNMQNAFAKDRAAASTSAKAIPATASFKDPKGTMINDGKLPEIAGKPGINRQLAYQAEADMLDTVSQSISNYQMSKLPTPTRSMSRAVRFNTYVDNSEDINSIDTQANSVKKFIKDNSRDGATRRASVMSLMNRVNQAKAHSFMAKGNAEREIENKNVAMAFENSNRNNEIGYQNASDKYNAAMASYNRSSQITSNFSDKIGQLGVNAAQMESNDIAYAAMLGGLQPDVRKRMTQNIGVRPRGGVRSMFS